MISFIPCTGMPEKQNLSSEQPPGHRRQEGGKVTIRILQKSQDLVPEHPRHLGDFPANISPRSELFSASAPRNFPGSCFGNLSLGIGMEKLQHQTSPAQGNPQPLLCAQKTMENRNFHWETFPGSSQAQIQSLVRIYLLFS